MLPKCIIILKAAVSKHEVRTSLNLQLTCSICLCRIFSYLKLGKFIKLKSTEDCYISTSASAEQAWSENCSTEKWQQKKRLGSSSLCTGAVAMPRKLERPFSSGQHSKHWSTKTEKVKTLVWNPHESTAQIIIFIPDEVCMWDVVTSTLPIAFPHFSVATSQSLNNNLFLA